MKRAIVLLLCLLVLPALAFAQSANDTGTTPKSSFKGHSDAITAGSGSLAGGGATMAPRFFRSGTPGDACSEFSSGEFNYIQVPFRTDSSGSLSANFDPGTCGTGAYVTFHTGFNPRSICSGYVWSYGSSAAFSESFAVPPNTTMYMIVSSVANAPVSCGPFTYSLDGTAEAVPTLPEWGMILLAALVVAAGVWTLRRRARSVTTA